MTVPNRGDECRKNLKHEKLGLLSKENQSAEVAPENGFLFLRDTRTIFHLLNGQEVTKLRMYSVGVGNRPCVHCWWENKWYKPWERQFATSVKITNAYPVYPTNSNSGHLSYRNTDRFPEYVRTANMEDTKMPIKRWFFCFNILGYLRVMQYNYKTTFRMHFM